MYNIPLFRKAMEAIEADPASWDQGWWMNSSRWDGCGTTMCLAGHALVQSGKYEMIPGRGLTPERMVLVETGEEVDVARTAEYELGLSASGANSLFQNTARDPAVLRTAIETLVGERL